MTTTRNLAIVAFTSIGLNVFLGGVLAGKMMRADEPGIHEEMRARHEASRSEHDAPDRRRSDLHSHHRGAKSAREAGPTDLALLRQMIRVMGGPKDPRIARLREERKDEIAKIRSEMSSAHKRVHDALTAKTRDDNELREALKNLRKTAFEAQARAQEGILTLADLMTEEERSRLRDHGSRQRPGKPKAPAPRDEVNP